MLLAKRAYPDIAQNVSAATRRCSSLARAARWQQKRRNLAVEDAVYGICNNIILPVSCGRDRVEVVD